MFVCLPLSDAVLCAFVCSCAIRVRFRPQTNLVYFSTFSSLKCQSIAVALTIEPRLFTTQSGQEDPSPSRRLRGLQVVHGYMLPDPDVPNRLTVWFTGGELSPAPPPQDGSQEENSEYGGLEEWKELFGGEHKRTWKESFSVMGAKLFLGAELQDSMDSNGTMSYTLHRPYGGHGKAYVDVSDPRCMTFV
jgi:hypothetical protein